MNEGSLVPNWPLVHVDDRVEIIEAKASLIPCKA